MSNPTLYYKNKPLITDLSNDITRSLDRSWNLSTRTKFLAALQKTWSTHLPVNFENIYGLINDQIYINYTWNLFDKVNIQLDRSLDFTTHSLVRQDSLIDNLNYPRELETLIRIYNTALREQQGAFTTKPNCSVSYWSEQALRVWNGYCHNLLSSHSHVLNIMLLDRLFQAHQKYFYTFEQLQGAVRDRDMSQTNLVVLDMNSDDSQNYSNGLRYHGISEPRRLTISNDYHLLYDNIGNLSFSDCGYQPLVDFLKSTGYSHKSLKGYIQNRLVQTELDPDITYYIMYPKNGFIPHVTWNWKLQEITNNRSRYFDSIFNMTYRLNLIESKNIGASSSILI